MALNTILATESGFALMTESGEPLILEDGQTWENRSVASAGTWENRSVASATFTNRTEVRMRSGYDSDFAYDDFIPYDAHMINQNNWINR